MRKPQITEIRSEQIAEQFERFAVMAFEWAKQNGMRPGDVMGALAWTFARLKRDHSIPSLDGFNATEFVELSRTYQRILSGVELRPQDDTRLSGDGSRRKQ